MTLPTGNITLGEVASELGESAPMELGDADARALANKKTGTITLGDLRGADQIQFTLTAGVSGATIGYQVSSFGSLVQPRYLDKTVNFAADITGTGRQFRFTLAGTHVQATAFRSISVNGRLFYAADATFTSSNTWTWSTDAGLVNGQQYLFEINVGPETVGYSGSTTVGPVGQTASEWTLTFEDDFSGSSLDPAKWNTAIFYETPDATINYSVASGCLNIWPAAGFVNRTIDTDGKFAQQYGFFEMRAKLPIGKGVVPAFWLYYHGNDADTPGIDIMKTWCGASTGGSNGGASALSIHYYGDSTIYGHSGTFPGDPDPGTVGTPMPVTFDANIDSRYTTTNYGLPGMSMQKQWDGYDVFTSWNTRLANESVNADIIIINNCINDAYEALGTANYKQRIRDIVGAARAAGSYVILQTPNETDDSTPDEYRNAMLEVASELGVYVIDVYTYSVNVRAGGSIYTLCPDGYQPSQAHYNGIGAYCATRFEEIIAADSSAPQLESGTGAAFANGSFHPINYQGGAYNNSAASLGTRLLSSTGQSPDLSAEFHSYGVKWDQNGNVTYYFDGAAVGAALATSGALTHAMYPLLTLWFGGASGTPDGTTPTGVSNAYQIDYVRAWSYGSGGVTNPTTPTSGDIEFYGNSTLRGYIGDGLGYYPITPVQAFAAVRTEYNAINEAVNSTQAHQLVAGNDGVHGTFATEMSTSPAEFVVLGFGSLDQFDVSTSAFMSTYATMFQLARSAGKIPVVMTPFVSQFSGTPTFAQAARDAAAANNVPVLDVFNFTANYIAARSGNLYDYVPDGIHPNQELGIAAGQFMASEWLTKVTGSAPPPTTGGGSIYPYGQGTSGYTLTFNEEFDGTSLDTSKWNDHVWYESSHPTINYRVQNGQLDIWPAAPFVNRTIDTDGKFYQTYGFFEAEMKLPIGRGCWPAFWLYNHDVGAERPEIDIMEAYSGGSVDGAWASVDMHPLNVGMTMHAPVPGGTWVTAGGFTTRTYVGVIDYSAAFHKYGCKWEPSGVTFYLDGVQVGPKITNLSERMTRRMYIMLDLWYGSESGTPNTSETPQGPSNSFSIKYVRAWQFS